MNIRPFVLPTALLVLSAQSAFGAPATKPNMHPDVKASYLLMEDGKAKSAAGKLLDLSMKSEGTLNSIKQKVKDGNALTPNDVAALAGALDTTAQVMIAQGVLVKTFANPMPETEATRQHAAQMRRAGSEASHNATIAAGTALHTQDGCATFFKKGIPDISSLVGDSNLNLSPLEAQMQLEAAKDAAAVLLLTKEVVNGCSPYLTTMQASRKPTQVTPSTVGQLPPASKTQAGKALPQPTMQTPPKAIPATASAPHKTMTDELALANKDIDAGNCDSAIQHVSNAKETAVYSFNKLSEIFNKQGFITPAMLDAHEVFLDDSANVAATMGRYIGACSPQKPETKKTQADAAKIKQDTENRVATAKENTDLAGRGACQEVFERGAMTPPASPWETAGSGGLSPLQLDAVIGATQGTSTVYLEMKETIRLCRKPLLDLRR